MKAENLCILKLGGSLLTDKTKPKSIRHDILNQVIQEIVDADEKLILIHGGGSFGHPIAKKYKISDGIDKSIINQILGLTETHYTMNKLNSIIFKSFLKKFYPCLPIQTSSSFIQDNQQITSHAIKIIETALDLDILPILYGDILLDVSGSFSILSGDHIIYLLCRDLQRFNVSKVIFAMDIDGIYIKDENEENEYKLAKIIYKNELKNLELANLENKIDVTGGIRGKIKAIEKILEFKIPIQLINGLIEGYIYSALKNATINCTTIIS